MRWSIGIAVAALAVALGPQSQAADADAGARVFKTQCGTCHAVVEGKNLVGPSLFGVVGRKAGEVPGFRYSAAVKDANLSWDPAKLDAYVANPQAVIPGTSMLYAGLKNDAQRADVIAYVQTLK